MIAAEGFAVYMAVAVVESVAAERIVVEVGAAAGIAAGPGSAPVAVLVVLAANTAAGRRRLVVALMGVLSQAPPWRQRLLVPPKQVPLFHPDGCQKFVTG